MKKQRSIDGQVIEQDCLEINGQEVFLPVTEEEAKQLVAEHKPVPPERWLWDN